ncbi:hypothetical protein J3F83DRAFT_310754 [Trichoderma novae-zelandiae]
MSPGGSHHRKALCCPSLFSIDDCFASPQLRSRSAKSRQCPLAFLRWRVASREPILQRKERSMRGRGCEPKDRTVFSMPASSCASAELFHLCFLRITAAIYGMLPQHHASGRISHLVFLFVVGESGSRSGLGRGIGIAQRFGENIFRFACLGRTPVCLTLSPKPTDLPSLHTSAANNRSGQRGAGVTTPGYFPDPRRAARSLSYPRCLR